MSGLDPLKGVVNNKEEKSSYTQEFRDPAVKLIAEQGCKIPDVARNLGIKERFFLGGVGLWQPR
ncbi:MAG: transposase [Proteobacteria bacterium]|nr:transposase [Desulfocapsa sp.]MBU3946474.1 transposase [Pseudomonadota bacterium]MCG2744369.1 transposase [Desulfobacteraceae bacterium]MBU4028318.1 transposase [Pseudomonadota bacterium]MBU4044142.1 transposase [Pseudomonadota bacterium]